MRWPRLAQRVPVLVAIVSFCAAVAGAPARADADADHALDVTAATDRATQWLAALDGGRYGETWGDASAVMKAGRTEQDWIDDITRPRATLGKPLMRELRHAAFSTSVRGAAEGKYVTATYLTQFPKTAPALETILLVLEDGQWRIAGYSLAGVPDLPAPRPAQPGSAAKPEG